MENIDKKHGILALFTVGFLYLLNLKKSEPIEQVKDGNTNLIRDTEFIELKMGPLEMDFIVHSLDWSKSKFVQNAQGFWETHIPTKLDDHKIYFVYGKKTLKDIIGK